MDQLPDYDKIRILQFPGKSWAEEITPRASAAAIEFMRSLMALDPVQRPTASQALLHPWLAEAPRLGAADMARLVALARDYSAAKPRDVFDRTPPDFEGRNVGSQGSPSSW
jgi:serine/threonine protein kinase